MAGIYIHIPFCRQKCHYCDFYKTDKLNYLNDYLAALEVEMSQQKNYLSGEEAETIYIGGGTPSLVTGHDLNSLLTGLYNYFTVSPQAEITIEANPDDLNPAYLSMLINAGINRISIGIQAFQNEHLKKMNRRHDTNQAVNSVYDAKKAGFNNISVDLIYGIPGLTSGQWKDNLQKVFELPVDHLSAYHLTFHKGTIFYNLLKRGLLNEISEEESFEQFMILTEDACTAGFEQYEISNFARNRLYSRHNRAYWTGRNYLGLGTSAHSYNGSSRRWNIASLEQYIKLVNEGENTYKEEQLTPKDMYNEYILTNLRTNWGVSLSAVNQKFGKKAADDFLRTARKHISTKMMIQNHEIFTLSPEGLFISDNIIAEFIII